MGSLKDKTDYSEETKEEIRQAINKLGGSLNTSTTFRNYELGLEDVYEEMPKVSGEGSIINLSNVREGGLSIIPKGNCEQDTYTGKNLLPLTNQDFTVNNVHYYVENGMLILNGTSTGETLTNNINFKNNFKFTLPAGNYKAITFGVNRAVYIKKYSDDSFILSSPYYFANGVPVNFTLNEETELYISFYIYQQSFNNLINPIMIVSENNPTSPFEKYVRWNP